MASEGPGRAGAPSLTSLPRIEDIPQAGEGLDAERVREAFDAFRRHAAQLQAQLRVLQVAGTRPGAGAAVEATGHAVRMDALHMIRAAAEFADTIERDAQNASATQLGRTEEEVSRRQRELQEREADIERYRQESERQRADMLNAARNESRELLSKAHADATREVQEAARAQHGAEQLLAAAGLGEDATSTSPRRSSRPPERRPRQAGPRLGGLRRLQPRSQALRPQLLR
jgi:predicted ribosome quality control (RQC) complex YloA/Tae2 family protein